MAELTAERVRELLDYDPETGVFRWRADAGCGGRIPAGTVAGSVSRAHGYVQINFGLGSHKAHRLAWLYMNGEWPEHEIDHKNRIRSDNRFTNLREVTTAQNLQNKNRYRNNTSGCPGVHWRPTAGKWQARIGLDGKRISLGHYKSAAEAAAAYQNAKANIHQINRQA